MLYYLFIVIIIIVILFYLIFFRSPDIVSDSLSCHRNLTIVDGYNCQECEENLVTLYIKLLIGMHIGRVVTLYSTFWGLRVIKI